MAATFRSSSVLIASIIGIFAVFLVDCEEVMKIKIVDSPALSKFSSPSSTRNKLSIRTQPSNLTGPPHLHQLNGSCFEGSERGYKYRVCPFQNVTQKEERQSWMSFHGVLGVWRDWIVENDTFVGLNFILGEPCGAVDREAKVMFNCSTKTRVHNITESSTCSYIIWLDTPMACFKGAMKVYHVLTNKQIEEWDMAEQEYYGNEITFKGLSKKRKSLLVEAGLCNPLKTDPDKDSKPAEEGLAIAAADNHDADDKSSEILKCQQERESLQKELQEINRKVNDVVKAHPHLAALLNFSHSVNVTTNGTSIEEHNTVNINNDADKNQIEEKSQRDDRELVALLNEEGLLSDQV